MSSSMSFPHDVEMKSEEEDENVEDVVGHEDVEDVKEEEEEEGDVKEMRMTEQIIDTFPRSPSILAIDLTSLIYASLMSSSSSSQHLHHEDDDDDDDDDFNLSNLKISDFPPSSQRCRGEVTLQKCTSTLQKLMRGRGRDPRHLMEEDESGMGGGDGGDVISSVYGHKGGGGGEGEVRERGHGDRASFLICGSESTSDVVANCRRIV